MNAKFHTLFFLVLEGSKLPRQRLNLPLKASLSTKQLPKKGTLVRGQASLLDVVV